MSGQTSLPIDQQREQQIIQWVENDLGYNDYSLKPASADASFRRYFRLFDHINGDSKIIMDAPPDKENSHPFIELAHLFFDIGLNVPRVYAQDFSAGFFLLSDLGVTDYLTVIKNETADQLYKDAIGSLIRLQTQPLGGLPDYDAFLLNREMHLFPDWYLLKHKKIQLSQSQYQILLDTFALLETSALSQPQVSVHRDYHSRNLMQTKHNNPGILDFQDAVFGPISYDLVSLLRDCYISWPQERITQWLRYYFDLANSHNLLKQVSYQQFEKWFDLMGLQRHLKAIGIFARLNYRDAKPGYLNDIPRTLGYLKTVSQKYSELADFHQLVSRL